MMTALLYNIQKFSCKSEIIFISEKTKGLFKVLLLLLAIFVSLNSSAQTISNVGITTGAVCPGSTVTISFTATNGTGSSKYFTTSTRYTIWVSVSGTPFTQWTTVSSSSTPPSGDGGSAILTLSNLIVPTTFPLGTGNKISIASSTPNIPQNSGSNVSGPITVGPNPSLSYSKVWASPCNGGTDGSLNIIPNGGTSPYTFKWTGPNGFTATTQNITNLKLGDYTIVMEDKNLCNATVSGITIGQAPVVQVGFTKTNPGCAGNDGTISAYRIGGVYDNVNPIQYKLNNGAFQNSGNFTGLSAGSYTVTAKDSKGCTGQSVAIILQNTPSLVFTNNFTNINVSGCGNGSDGSSSLEVSGGLPPYQYKLDNVVQIVTAATTHTFSGLKANTLYSISVTDSKGCSISKSLTLTQTTKPSAQISYKGNVSCNGGDDGLISVANGIGGAPGFYMYSIDGGVSYQSKNSFYNLTAGNYNVVVKDSKGCESSPLPVVISQAAPLVFKTNGYSTDVSACGGGSDGTITPVVTGGTPPYHYSIDGAEKQVTSAQYFTFSGLAAGTHAVSVSDSKGCFTISKNVTITQASAPVAHIAYQGNEKCISSNDGFITVATGAGGVPEITFSKDGGITYQTSYVFYNLSPGTYNIMVKDSRGCTSPAVAVTIRASAVNCTTGRYYDNSSLTDKHMNATDDKNQSAELLANSNLEIKAFPNPFASEFILDVKGVSQEKISLIVTDVLGRRMYYEEGKANQQYKFGNSFGRGTYIVQVIQGDNIKTIKIVKE